MMAENEVVYTFRAVDEVSGPMKAAKAQLDATAEAMARTEASASSAIPAAQGAASAGETAVTAIDSLEVSAASVQSARAQMEATAKAAVDAKAATDGAGASASSASSAGSSAAVVLDNAGQTAEKTTARAKAAETQLNATATAAASATASQQTAILKSVETLTALQGLQSGISAITSAVGTLGLVDEETYKTLQKVTAGIQLVVGTAQAVKGVVTLFQSLNAVLKTTAIVSTFASIAENPAKGAAIIAGASLAAGAVGGYMMSSINNTKTTTINVQHESTARTAETVVDAGAWY